MVIIKFPWSEETDDKLFEIGLPIICIVFGISIMAITILFSEPILSVLGLLPICIGVMLMIINGQISFEYKQK